MEDVLLCNSVRAHKIIILGDFNSTPDQIRRLRHEAGPFLLSLHQIQNPSQRPRPNCSRNIDYIFSSFPPLSALNTSSDPTDLSDHDPVIAEFSCSKKMKHIEFPNRHFNFVTVQNCIKAAESLQGINPQCATSLLNSAAKTTRVVNGIKRFKKIKMLPPVTLSPNQ